MPAYEIAEGRYLPSKVCLKDGKRCPYLKWWTLETCAGMAVVFWNGSGGYRTFHSSTPNTPLMAKWYMQDELGRWSEGEIPPTEVYEDPTWQKNTRIDTERHLRSEGKVERLVDPNDARKIDEKGHEHRYQQ